MSNSVVPFRPRKLAVAVAIPRLIEQENKARRQLVEEMAEAIFVHALMKAEAEKSEETETPNDL